MERRASLFLVLLAILPSFVRAQTLDDLKHPLVKRGQAAVSADYDTYAIEHGAANILYGDMSFFESRQVVAPAIAFGLTPHLQARVTAAYEFPTLFSYPTFEAWDYIREKTEVKALSVDLLFRPRPNLEFRATSLFGRYAWTSDYARSRNANAAASEQFDSTIVLAGGTWLPGARPVRDGTIAADLDGLNHPLLQRHRPRIDFEVMGRWYRHDFHDSNDAGADFVAMQIHSRDVRLRAGGAYGITDSLQVSVDAYVHPPFDLTHATQSRWSADPAVPPDAHSYEQRFHVVHGALLDGRWRAANRVEMFATGTWEHQAISISTASQPPGKYRTSTFTFGGTVLTKRPRRTYALAADIPGLYHPLVEPKQVKIDAFAYYYAYREPGDLLDLDVRVYRAQATTGITSWLQASAYGGALLSKHYMSGGQFERHGSFGGELNLRVRNGTDFYGSLEQHRAGFVGQYPMFVIATGEDAGSFDFLNPAFEGAYTAHLGVRFVF